ncbi:unnamed protein product, partial [Mesorhabditis belari]|uniref:Phosphodiesterase n=1 Tax=Mesorhabditis belari TaxID=2138241 RepID=A0AAF3J1B3_9BILA
MDEIRHFSCPNLVSYEARPLQKEASMSLVELRRNSLPQVGTGLSTEPVFRKSSHPAQFLHNNNNACYENEPPPRKASKDDLAVPSERLQPRTCTPQIFHRLLAQSEDMNNLVHSITQEAKSLLNAETCSLFLIDSERKELVAEIFDQSDNLTEVRLPMDKGIVGRVASTGVAMNVKNVARCPFFYRTVDEMTGFHTRNVLCVPIRDNSGAFVGVAELCNKIGKSNFFTRQDEAIARTFAVYAATSISHCLLYRKVQEAQRRSHMAAELLVQGSQLLVSSEEVKHLTEQSILPALSFHPKFDQFYFTPRIIGDSETYVRASQSMFQELGFIQRYNIRRDRLAHFLLRISRGYRDVPYHNWSHAFSVAHFCYLLLRTSSVVNSLSELEQLALLIACLCHDIDHRGTNNTFQIKSRTPLAQLYSSEGSVLERHHYAQTVSILGMDDCNILDQLSKEQYQRVLSHIRDIILATDIAAHLNKVDRIRRMIDNGFNVSKQEDHYLLLCLLMTASDLSDQSKEFHYSKQIAESVYCEFFSQGDLEKQMGEPPVEMMDRDRAFVPQLQIDFLDNVAMPVYQMLSYAVPETVDTYTGIQATRKHWGSLHEVLRERNEPVLGLEFLRDGGLEREVVRRVTGKDPGPLLEDSEPNSSRGRRSAPTSARTTRRS